MREKLILFKILIWKIAFKQLNLYVNFWEISPSQFRVNTDYNWFQLPSKPTFIIEINTQK